MMRRANCLLLSAIIFSFILDRARKIEKVFHAAVEGFAQTKEGGGGGFIDITLPLFKELDLTKGDTRDGGKLRLRETGSLAIFAQVRIGICGFELLIHKVSKMG